jgi:general secretion pathway protein D
VNYGTNYIGAYGDGAVERMGFQSSQSSDLSNLLTGQITNLSGFFAGIGLGGTQEFTLPDGTTTVKVNSISMLLKVLAANSKTNVLATPQILAMDNTEASFEVGETVPITETTQNNNGSTQGFSQQKVALILKITPQINKVTRFVKLKIDQRIDDFASVERGANNAAGGVATTTRSAVTEVIIRDQDTIAMGGLMRDKTTETEAKVPLLGDIPVLGWLFKQKTRAVNKVNLLFFLTPKILASYEDTAAKNTRDQIARRSQDIKKILVGEDPYEDELNELDRKLEKQEKGPLYNLSTSRKYREENQGEGIGVGEGGNDFLQQPQTQNRNDGTEQFYNEYEEANVIDEEDGLPPGLGEN